MSLVIVLKLLTALSVVLMIFALALRAQHADWLYLIRHPWIGLRSLAIMFGLVPCLALATCLGFGLSDPVKIAIMALALSPLPPLLPVKRLKSPEQLEYISGLLVGSAAVSLIAAPVWASIVNGIFPHVLSLPPGKIALPLAITVALPLAMGRIGAMILDPTWANRVSNPIGKVSTALLVACALVWLALLAKPMWILVGNGTLLSIAVFILLGMMGGYLFCGPDKSVPGLAPILSWACVTRHPGCAIAIAAVVAPDERMAPAAIILFVLVNALLGMPLLRMIFVPHTAPSKT